MESSKVGRSSCDVWVMLVPLIGTLCLAETGDEIRPESTKSFFELARMGGFRGMGGAGFRITPEPGIEVGGKGGEINVSPSPKADFRALSWVRLGRDLCCTLDWRGIVPFRATIGFAFESLPFFSASAVVGFGTTTQSGSFWEMKGFDDLFGFGKASLNGASRFDRAARPVSSDLLFLKISIDSTRRWKPYHNLTTTCFDRNS